MKRILVILLIVGLFLGIQSIGLAAEKVTVTISCGTVGKEFEVLKKQLNMFMKKYPNITAKPMTRPESSTETHDLYVTWLSGGAEKPDIYMLDIIWPPEVGAAGWMLPLNKYLPSKERAKFLPGPINGCTYKGKLVAIPWFTDAGLLYYRKDLLGGYGFAPPETFTDLVLSAKIISGPMGIDGFVWQGAKYEGLVCDFLEYVWGSGGAALDKEGNVVINSPQAVGALQFMVDEINKYKISPKGVLTYMEEDTRHIFQQGKAVYMRNWPYCWPLLKGADSKVKGKVGTTPMVHAVGEQSAATLGGWNLGISKFSKHPEEAVKLVLFLTSLKQQAYKAIHAGQNPTRMAAYKDPEVLKANPFYKNLYDVFIHAKPRPVSPFYPRISLILQQYVHKALAQEISAKKALDKAAAEIKELLK